MEMHRDQIQAFYPMTLAVRRLFHRLAHAAGELHAETDVTPGMRAVLESLIEGGPKTVPQLARMRPVSRQHIQGLVNALRAAGYVAYEDNPGHRRSHLVAPTEAGRRRHADMRARERRALERLALDIPADELAACGDVLRTLIARFESADWRRIVEEITQNHDQDHEKETDR